MQRDLRLAFLNKEVKGANYKYLEEQDAREREDGIYCKIATTHYPRCTKKTFPSCACGKLVYNQGKNNDYDYI